MILNLEFDHRPKANLQRLKDLSIALPFVDLPFFALQVGDVYVSG